MKERGGGMRANKNGDNAARFSQSFAGCGVAKWLVRGAATAPESHPAVYTSLGLQQPMRSKIEAMQILSCVGLSDSH